MTKRKMPYAGHAANRNRISVEVGPVIHDLILLAAAERSTMAHRVTPSEVVREAIVHVYGGQCPAGRGAS